MRLLHAFVAAACASVVSAHGVLVNITLGGKSYQGPGPAEESSPALDSSPIRQVGSRGPTTSANITSADMACGVGSVGVKTSTVAEVKAGGSVTLQMTPGWMHLIGPVTTYLGKCPSGDATDCEGKDLKWFKIDAEGYIASNNSWFQGNFMNKGIPGTVTIPEGLQSGDYLLRYEIAALHLAMNEGYAEFFISCTQLRVTDGGSAYPTDEYLVNFPGAYTATDPGILVDVYTNFHSYDYPGPALWTGNTTGSSGDSSSTEEAPSSTADATTAPSTTDSSTESTSTELSTTVTSSASSSTVTSSASTTITGSGPGPVAPGTSDDSGSQTISDSAPGPVAPGTSDDSGSQTITDSAPGPAFPATTDPVSTVIETTTVDTPPSTATPSCAAKRIRRSKRRL